MSAACKSAIAFAAILVFSRIAHAQNDRACPIELRTDVGGQVYQWELTNQAPQALVCIDAPEVGTYAEDVTEGWSLVEDADNYAICANSPDDYVRTGETLVVTVRVLSQVAVPASGTLRFELENGQVHTLAGVCVPKLEPASPRLIAALLPILLSVTIVATTRKSAVLPGD